MIHRFGGRGLNSTPYGSPVVQIAPCRSLFLFYLMSAHPEEGEAEAEATPANATEQQAS